MTAPPSAPTSTPARLCALALAALLAGCAGTGPGPDPTPHRPAAPTTTERSPTPRPSAAASPDEAVCPQRGRCYGPPTLAGRFDADTVLEASGLAASRRNPGVLYLLDDGPGTQQVWAIETDGRVLGAVPIAGLDGVDTESLEVAPCGDDAGSCVYVGDIGDNRRSRHDVVVHRFAEPDLSGGPPDEPLAATSIRLRYPNGPHDAEALLVDDAGAVHIVTKAPYDREAGVTGDTRLYGAEGFTDGELVDLGAVPVPPSAEPLQSRFVGDVVTGGSYLPGRVLLRTYDQVLLYVAPEPEAALSTLPGWRVEAVPAPPEPQPEAITWAADGCGYHTAGEMVTGLWHVPCADGQEERDVGS